MYKKGRPNCRPQRSFSIPNGQGFIGVVGDDADAALYAEGHDLLVVHRPGVDADAGGQGPFDHAGIEKGPPMGMDVLSADGLRVFPGLIEAVTVQDARREVWHPLQ